MIQDTDVMHLISINQARRCPATSISFWMPSYLQLYKEVVGPAQPHNSPADGVMERDWHHYFKDVVGAIDDTHFKANVPQWLQARYRNRHATISQNVLLGCTFDMKFTYILAGWEGSAHDGRLLRDVISRNGNRLTLPSGKYYLADAGFPSSRGFLTPFRGVHYHLRDQQRRRPQNAKELFNYRHSSNEECGGKDNWNTKEKICISSQQHISQHEDSKQNCFSVCCNTQLPP